MSNFTYYDKEKSNLYKEAAEFNSPKDIDSQFKIKFFSLIEKCNLKLMTGKDSFFGNFMLNVKKQASLGLKWPIETTRTSKDFIMKFDVKACLELTEWEMQGLIKHEIYHIMYSHYDRAQALEGRYRKSAINIAMDVSVNQYINYPPSFTYTIDKVNFLYNLTLKKGRSFEEYALKLNEVMKDYKLGKAEDKSDIYDMELVHDSWRKSDVLNKEYNEDLVKIMAKRAVKDGNVPEGLEAILGALEMKAEISWSNYLKRLVMTMPHGYKKTITRKDRRQPERLDLRGNLRDRVANILLVMDISGSITTGEIRNILKEVFEILKSCKANIKIAECDDKVRRIYDIRDLKDIKPRLDKTGATAFSPLFSYVKEQNLKDTLVVYFTDGLGEKELKVKPVNYKTIWVLTGKEKEISLEKPYGRVLSLKNKREYDEDKVGIHIARDMIHDIQGEVSVLTFDL